MEEINLKSFSDFSLLFERIRNGNLSANINIMEYGFLEPKDILMLTQYFVVQNFHDINGTLFISNENGWYIQQINLIGFCNTNYINPCPLKATIRTAIPIKRVGTSTMNSYIEDAQNFFAKFCFGKDISALNICISEIINNVSDHSRSQHDSFIFSQYYSQPRKIVFAISDLGVGIPKTVNEFMKAIAKDALTDFEAVAWAFQRGQSVKSKSHNAGAGLDNIISNLRGIGEIQIYTNNVYCKVFIDGSKRFQVNPIKNFIGTLIEITIFTNKLDKIDETILDVYSF